MRGGLFLPLVEKRVQVVSKLWRWKAGQPIQEIQSIAALSSPGTAWASSQCNARRRIRISRLQWLRVFSAVLPMRCGKTLHRTGAVRPAIGRTGERGTKLKGQDVLIWFEARIVTGDANRRPGAYD
jgi:hypothetical protein